MVILLGDENPPLVKIYEAVELAAARMRGEEAEMPRESVYGYE